MGEEIARKQLLQDVADQRQLDAIFVLGMMLMVEGIERKQEVLIMFKTMNNPSRKWMYERKDNCSRVSLVFVQGVKKFIDFATSQHSFMDKDKIKWQCIKFRKIPYREVDIVKHHLYKFGFVKEYWFRDKHDETSIDDDNTFLGVDDSNTNFSEGACSYREMAIDAMAPDLNTSNHEEEPNALDKKII
uniref:Transposase-associated domain-containing protein n=1 Tax=Lactuca sativa TaxID=4236 RepID=A0A9R1VI28_LACSA|nr:hypothetical protein LSAT_V11C500238250 [Lactuca sativa]